MRLGFELQGLDWSHMFGIGVTRLGLRALTLGLELWGWDGNLEARIGTLRLGFGL